jgi:hypothetical protein
MNLFFEAIDKCVIPRSTRVIPPQEVDDNVASLFLESMLLNEKIFFHINGPNLEIVPLLRWFSLKEVEQLIEEEILHFIFVHGAILYLTKENISNLKLSSPPGLNFLRSFEPSWESITDGTTHILKEQTNLSRSERRNLSNLIEKKTLYINREDYKNYIYETTRSDVRGEIGRSFGFKNVENPDDGSLNNDLMSNYISIAKNNSILYLSAKSNCLSIIGEESTNEILKMRLGSISQAMDKKIDNFQYIKEFEDLPDLFKLYKSGKYPLNKIVKIRNTSDAQKFREWIHSVKSDTSLQTIKEYTASSFSKLSDKKWSKILRIVFNTGVGALIAPVNPVAGIATSVGLNALDTFLYDKIINKWEPKFFIDKLKEVTKAD